MTRQWRCNNCGASFQSDRQACAACGVDAQAEPRFAGVVVPVETVHFDPPHPVVRGYGTGRLACDPRKQVAGSRATGEPSVVNCPACRATPEWKRAYAGEPTLLESQNEAVTVSPCE